MYLNSTGVSGADPHTIKNPPTNLQLAINTCGSIDTSTDATNCGSCSTEVFIEKNPYPSILALQTCVVRGSAVLGQAGRAGDLLDLHN